MLSLRLILGSYNPWSHHLFLSYMTSTYTPIYSSLSNRNKKVAA